MSASSAIFFLNAIGLLTASASGADQNRWTTPSDIVTLDMDKPVVKQGGRFDPQQLGLVSRVSKLQGMRVSDEDHRSLGKVADVVLDLANGRALGCVVQRGDDHVFVSAEAFFPVSEDRVILTDENRRKFAQAPSIKWTAGQPLTLDLFSSAWPHIGGRAPQEGSPVSASTLIGKRVVGQGSRELGILNDIVADVPKGELVYLVVSPRQGSSLLYAVPPQKIQFRDGQLNLNADEGHFLAGPKFPRDFWTEMALPRFASAVYHHYGLLGDNSAAGVGLSPTGRQDNRLRDAFLSRLVHDAAMPAVHADDLTITTENGKLMLRGAVSSETARLKILAAAGAAAGAGNVVDLLTVR